MFYIMILIFSYFIQLVYAMDETRRYLKNAKQWRYIEIYYNQISNDFVYGAITDLEKRGT